MQAQPIDAVATRFGVSERYVKQRLRLGKVAPELLDASQGGRRHPRGGRGRSPWVSTTKPSSPSGARSKISLTSARMAVRRLLTQGAVPGGFASRRLCRPPRLRGRGRRRQMRSVQQPVAVLGEGGGIPYRVFDAEPDKPAEQQVVVKTAQPIAAPSGSSPPWSMKPAVPAAGSRGPVLRHGQ